MSRIGWSNAVEQFFQRSLSAHLPFSAFEKLQETTVLVAGLGGGSNIAELLARKGIGHLIIADPDIFESHNIRQRGHLISTLGKSKTEIMYQRLNDIYPKIKVTPIYEGITLENVSDIVQQADYIVDMIDFSALREKAALYQSCRELGKIVLTAPSVVNGAVLYIFTPEGISFEQFFGYEDGLPMHELGPRVMKRIIPRYPSEAPEELYQAAARGERTIPLDAVGVDQAAVLAVAAIENLVLGRLERVVTIPRGIHVDASDPLYLGQIIDYSTDFRDYTC
jgi:molybdopterin/thiamine biosynthesis adenylyltransferase